MPIISALLSYGKLVGVLADGLKALGGMLHDHRVAMEQKAKDLNEARTKADGRVSDGLAARNDDSLQRTVEQTRYRD